ncbi:hypothetical protein SAMN05428969_0605 [Devosia sp. YR412]|uniref:DUF1801 domain-containing protein n=1 Tax=Devosia sp. YR412 TaxID=1881030 RepID=UPI0008CCCEAE|nr:DUF1801 domain-containing protein [Devosia sp. YR412]SEP71971.1 hypothetical protein SAMN05428969_0605 [Devosia sp. YR412]
MTPDVVAVFETYPAVLKDRLLVLRALIYETASDTAGVGPLDETLKWGQVSYLTQQSGSGTTLRIDRDKATGQPALYVNCKTNLLSQYRTLYPEAFGYDGERGVVLGEAPDQDALRHVIALALTYHKSKTRAG